MENIVLKLIERNLELQERWDKLKAYVDNINDGTNLENENEEGYMRCYRDIREQLIKLEKL